MPSFTNWKVRPLSIVSECLIASVPGQGKTKDRLGVALLFAERVVVVNGTGAGPDDPAAIGKDRMRELFPVHHIFTDRVTPALARYRIGGRFVLEKEVVLAVVIHHAVRIIQPVLAGGEVKLRAVVWS